MTFCSSHKLKTHLSITIIIKLVDYIEISSWRFHLYIVQTLEQSGMGEREAKKKTV